MSGGATAEEIAERQDEERPYPSDGELDAMDELLAEGAGQPWVGNQHLAGDPAEQPSSTTDQDQQTAKQRHDDRRAGDDERHRDDEADEEQRGGTLRHGGDGQNIGEANPRNGDRNGHDRVPETLRLLHQAAPLLLLAEHRLTEATPDPREAEHS